MVALHRSAWIEIKYMRLPCTRVISRTPQECVDRNLGGQPYKFANSSRTPQECVDRNAVMRFMTIAALTVALHRSAWIEIISCGCNSGSSDGSHSTGVRG